MYRPPMIVARSVQRRLSCFGIAAIAVVTLLGHACLVPLRAEGASVPITGSHHGETDSVPDSSHATLCEGIAAKAGASASSMTLRAVALVAVAFGASSSLSLFEGSYGSFTPRANVSPPLFLLHASFRI